VQKAAQLLGNTLVHKAITVRRHGGKTTEHRCAHIHNSIGMSNLILSVAFILRKPRAETDFTCLSGQKLAELPSPNPRYVYVAIFLFNESGWNRTLMVLY
jgi:hypothetical protein